MRIAFFDFDGTITRGDSLLVFLKFMVGKKKFYLGMIKNIHFLLAYQFGFISNAKAKERVIQHFLQGMEVKALQEKCLSFLPILERMIKKSALQRIQYHQKQGDQVVIVSATFACYLRPLAQKLQVQCLATELEEEFGRLNGRFASPNCYGEEKVHRIINSYKLENFEEIFAYGDSRGDFQMLSLATQRFYKFFK